MRNLIKFIVQRFPFLLFLFLELLSVFLIFSGNRYYNSGLNSLGFEISGGLSKAKNDISGFMRLGRVNDSLVAENVRLQMLLSKNYTNHGIEIDSMIDTLNTEMEQIYTYMPAKVVDVTTDKAKNYIVLNRGSRHGINKNMGVFNSQGIVGITVNVSRNYTLVISVLNTDSKFSVKLRRSNYYGNLSWDTRSSRYALLSQIPNHVKVAKGDTIVTSGFSSFFPADIMVGKIEDFHEIPGSNFLELRVKLSTDFHNLSYVYVVNFLKKSELQKLEELANE